MISHNSENIQRADIIIVNKKRVVILFFKEKKGEIKERVGKKNIVWNMGQVVTQPLPPNPQIPPLWNITY